MQQTQRSRILSSAAAMLFIASIGGMAYSIETDNPYRKARVGDWATYKVTNHFGNSLYASEERRTITANNGRFVTIKVENIRDKEEPIVLELKIDITKPLTAVENLDFSPPGPGIKEIASGKESLQIAGRKMDVRWTTFQIGQTDDVERKMWFSEEVPLNGCVKDLRAHRSLRSLRTRELIDFGFAGQGSSAPGLAAKHDPALDRKLQTNSVGQTLLWIPSGDFVMGGIPYNEFVLNSLDATTDERMELLLKSPPQQPKIVSSPFWMSAHEVTIGQFRQFVETTNYRSDAERDGRGGTGLRADGTWGAEPKFTWREYGVPVTDDHPVANVSWNDANAYCQWLSKKEGVEYRLPTEVEWEYACRAGTTTRYYCGDDPKSLAGHANMADQSLAKKDPRLPWALSHDDGHAYLAPVGQFTPNAFGLYDIHGNVLEWCSSEFSEFDPLPDFDAPARPDVRYVVRGGHWFGDPLLAGAASRSGAPPETSMALIGFRVVRVDDE